MKKCGKLIVFFIVFVNVMEALSLFQRNIESVNMPSSPSNQQAIPGMLQDRPDEKSKLSNGLRGNREDSFTNDEGSETGTPPPDSSSSTDSNDGNAESDVAEDAVNPAMAAEENDDDAKPPTPSSDLPSDATSNDEMPSTESPDQSADGNHSSSPATETSSENNDSSENNETGTSDDSYGNATTTSLETDSADNSNESNADEIDSSEQTEAQSDDNGNSTSSIDFVTSKLTNSTLFNFKVDMDGSNPNRPNHTINHFHSLFNAIFFRFDVPRAL
uniref:Dentin sialophosphoprotein-like n=1 Tax=Panagrolaimus sp. JU765 TaxID=591449 RepID=A0AC34Q946_9BILA